MAQSFFEGKAAPPAAEFLGWALVDENPENGTIEIRFEATAQMLNNQGTVQGGFVAAMLDDTMGPALVSMSGGEVAPSTIDLNVSFVRPVHKGPVIGKGRVVKRGRSVVFLEGELYDLDGKLLARGSSSAIPVAIRP